MPERSGGLHENLQFCGTLAKVVTAPSFATGSDKGWSGPWAARFQIHPVEDTFRKLVDEPQAGPPLSGTYRAAVSFVGAPSAGKSTVLRACMNVNARQPSSPSKSGAHGRDIQLYRDARTNTWALDFEGVAFHPEEAEKFVRRSSSKTAHAMGRRSSLRNSLKTSTVSLAPSADQNAKQNVNVLSAADAVAQMPNLRNEALQILLPSAAYALSDLIVFVTNLEPEECIDKEIPRFCKACVSKIRNAPRPRLLVVCNRREVPRAGYYSVPFQFRKILSPYFPMINVVYLPDFQSPNFDAAAGRLPGTLMEDLMRVDITGDADRPGFEEWRRTTGFEWLGLTYSIVSWLNRPEPLVMLLAHTWTDAVHGLQKGRVNVKLLNYLVAELLAPYGKPTEEDSGTGQWTAACGLVARFLRAHKHEVHIKEWSHVAFSLRQWVPCNAKAAIAGTRKLCECQQPLPLHGNAHRNCRVESDRSTPFPYHVAWEGVYEKPHWDDAVEAKKADKAAFDPWRACQELLVDYEGVAGDAKTSDLKGEVREKYLKVVINTGGLKELIPRLSLDFGVNPMCFVCFNDLEDIDKIAGRADRRISDVLFDLTAHTRSLRVCETCLERVHYHTTHRGNLGNKVEPQFSSVWTDNPELQGDFLFYKNDNHPQYRDQQCLRCHAPGRSMPRYGNPKGKRRTEWKWDQFSQNWVLKLGRRTAGKVPDYVVEDDDGPNLPSGDPGMFCKRSTSMPSLTRLPSLTVQPPVSLAAATNLGNSVCAVCGQKGPRCAALPCHHLYCSSCAFEWAGYCSMEERAWLEAAIAPPAGTFLGRIWNNLERRSDAGAIVPSTGRCAVCRVTMDGFFVLEGLPGGDKGCDWLRSWIGLGVECKP
eukprot:gnl/MRDRNA2_/MRDRNA2_123354_c0_seq1.p1 gnl/MRDRNA2_/MRDRNA2_123354_c0~~gnl/MRDRNA2_/MRDRNA2_123354_c0_seq1.p1  ORF type:complete len:872 (+),score=142.12 gnl/MRDRNA2_/MRDRNA2_123354_c0_seq1:125-2740(+)